MKLQGIGEKSVIKIILYDLDGVLVNACDWHYESLNRALSDICGFKIDRKDHEETYNGLPTRSKLELMISKNLIVKEDASKIWKLKQTYTEDTIKDLASIDEEKILIHKITKRMGISSMCVTNSIRHTAMLMLENTGQLDLLSGIVSNEDVICPKPDPEGYSIGMKVLTSAPEETLIIEDSDVGYAAAKASGAHVARVKDASEVTLDLVCKSIIKYNG